MSRKTGIFILLLLLITLGIIIYIRNPRPYKIVWAGWAQNRREHFLPCEDLPFFPQVKKTLQEHNDVAVNISGLNGATVMAQEIRCRVVEGGAEYIKGDIEITYASRGQRREIEKLIGNNFFGIPWRGKMNND